MKQPRSPIIVVMGHVDHGKTTLLDFIRTYSYQSARAAPDGGEPRPVAGREAGGITQATGAYEITHSNKKITFIDTPGHEAFSKMRERGAAAADLAILVVAAEDGVKPQTKEAIKILKETKTPYVVAINKIDKNNANIENTKADLLKNEVLLEGLGGDISWQAISAKTGQGIDELLDHILLAAEVENFEYDSDVPATGFIIEARREPQRGVEVMAIVKDGVLKEGDDVCTPTASGKVKILENFLKKKISEAIPSSPVIILGFSELPQVGEVFTVGKADIVVPAKENGIRHAMRDGSPENVGVFRMILKADVAGSLEAISDIVKSLPDIKLDVVSESVGAISDGDVQLAISTNAWIIGFKTKIGKSAETLAKNNRVHVTTSDIIYELVKTIEEQYKKPPEEEIRGELEILATFSKKNDKQTVGGRMVKGVLKIGARVEIVRGEEKIGDGKITNLQQAKNDVQQLTEGKEGGIIIDSGVTIEKGDRLRYK